MLTCTRLHEMGMHAGERLVELYFWRERFGKRECRLLPLLCLIQTHFWKHIFGKQADSLEKAVGKEDQCTDSIIIA